jgi:anti-sigma factor RsiW
LPRKNGVKREEFEHAVRAAGAVLGVHEVLVIGSQALHASVEGELPPEASRSVEVDIAAMDDADGRMADLIDGSIGEASMFHATFGYYAQGVVETTAVLPAGWRDRLVRFETPGTNGVVAWCLEPHDLWVSKAIAGRPKDIEFCRAVVDRGMVTDDLLRDRLAKVERLDDRVRSAVAARIPS